MNKSPRILITGSSGFIGAKAVDFFQSGGYEVLATDKMQPRNPKHAGCFSECDLLDGQKLKRLFVDFKPDYVLHLGARTDVFERRSVDGYSANMAGVANIIDAANACASLRRIIITSSRLVCPVGYQPTSDEDFCPPNYYGQSKVQTERITKSRLINAEWLITRPTGIWGPGFQIPSYRDFFEQVRHGRYFHLGQCNPLKTFGYVKNFVFQMEKLLLAPVEQVQGRVFYIGDYEPVPLRDWANLIAHEFGLKPIRTLPLGMLRGGAMVGDVLKRVGWTNFPLNSGRLRNMLSAAVHDLAPLQAITGPLPYTLAAATRETVHWLKENP